MTTSSRCHLSAGRWSITPDLDGEPVAEAIYPVADCLVGNRDTAFRQKILHVAQTQSKPVVGPDGVSDDTLRKPEAFDPRQIFDVQYGAELFGSCNVSNLTKPRQIVPPREKRCIRLVGWLCSGIGRLNGNVRAKLRLSVNNLTKPSP